MHTPDYSTYEVVPEMPNASENPTRPEQPWEWSTPVDTDRHMPETTISVPEEMEVDDADDPGEDPMIMEVDDDRHVRRSGRVTRPPRSLSPQTRARHMYTQGRHVKGPQSKDLVIPKGGGDM